MRSKLDERPECPEPAQRILTGFWRLLVRDGFNGFGSLPYLAVGDFLRSENFPEEEGRALLDGLCNDYNRHVKSMQPKK